jgi:hypothetical protein
MTAGETRAAHPAELSPGSVRDSALPQFLDRFVTPEAVYGLVLYAAIVGAVSDEADDPSAVDPALTFNDATLQLNESTGILIWVLLSTIVFWAAHVFAHAVAGHGVHDGEAISVGRATRLAFHHSAGMLYAPILPSIALLLGAFGVITDEAAVDVALWTSVGVLALLGFLAFTARGSRVIIRILGGLGTAVLGLVIIGINAVMH